MKIQQDGTFLLSVLQNVAKGRVMPAAFQRPYVWGKPQVLAFIESILRGYPIGGFLLWTPYKHADLSKVTRTRLGPIQGDTSQPGTSLLLDGQNRLATLAWITHDWATPLPDTLSDSERATWADGQQLVVDLGERQFKFVPAHEAHQGFRLPTHVFMDNHKFHTTVRQRWSKEWAGISEEDKDAAIVWVDAVIGKFKDARVVVTDMENATAAEAKDAFLHICSVGVPMSEKDLDAAMAWAYE